MRLYQAAVILLVVWAVFTGISGYVQTVDAATLPEEYQLAWSGIVYVFATSAASPLYVFLRNVYGYAENWLETEPEHRKEIQFQANLFTATWIKYEGYIKALGAGAVVLLAGTPLEPHAIYITGAVVFVIDLVRKSLSDLGKARAQT